MSRPPQLEPAWLIGLLLAWSRRETRNSGLGYYTISPMLRDGIPTPARSYEPTGYGGTELDAIGRAVNGLRLMRKLAVMRYLRPWMAPAIDAELERVLDTDTWMYHLRAALAELESDHFRVVAGMSWTDDLVADFIKSQWYNYRRALKPIQARDELLCGAKLYSFEHGTTLPTPLYMDAERTTVHANPIWFYRFGDAPEITMPVQAVDLHLTTMSGQTIARAVNCGSDFKV